MQVLHLVEDLRNHPAAFYISENIPIVICADDPGFWDSKGLSHDMYYAFMSFAPQNAGLKVLKQLAWNCKFSSLLLSGGRLLIKVFFSIFKALKYSGMSTEEKKNAGVEFKKQWDKFIDDVLDPNF